MLVFLQNRILPSAAGTWIESGGMRGPFTMNIVPINAFSGRPPSPGGLKRGSRQVPVHVGGSCGSITAFACVSLYDTSVRYGVFAPSMLFSQRVFQKTPLPVMNARLT